MAFAGRSFPHREGAYTWKTSAPVDHLAWVSLAAGLNQSVVVVPPSERHPESRGECGRRHMVRVHTLVARSHACGPAGIRPRANCGRHVQRRARLVGGRSRPGLSRAANSPGDDGLVSWLAVLRSDTGGVSWTKPYVQDSSVFAPLGLQADRNLAVAAHPVNKDIVLLGSRRTGLVGSTNGGVDWDYGRWNERFGDFHADVLCITSDPTDPSGNRVWSGSDGGIFVSGDQGVSWDSSRNARLPTLMFSGDATPGTESLGVNPSAAHPHVMVGALQDNGIAVANGLGVAWGQMVRRRWPARGLDWP